MAEFCEVMKQKQRMCDSFPDSCEGCPIHSWAANNAGTTYCEETFSKHYEKLEPLILKWAEEHPEPRYPTWVEWWDANFSGNGTRMFTPCSFISPARIGCDPFCDGCMIEPYKGIDCPDCWHIPIPADIAEKLGIKPIE